MDVHRYRIGMHRMNQTHVFFFLGMLLFLLAAPHLAAQPNLNFKRIWLNRPTVEIYFQAGCGGVPIYNLSKQDLRLIEDGHEIKDFTLWCPDPTARCAISVSLVFDASGSMMGSGNAGAKQAGHTFIDLMDGAIDEAAILWFTQVVTVKQQMTSDLPMLHEAVDSLPANGATAVWDGIYAGILELVNSGVNQCRAVVALTDGGDNSSNRTPSEIISLANRNRIRVYTVGVGSSINAVELELIALLTGGIYYQTPNAAQVASIYAEIARIIFHHFEECMITYERFCQDGQTHTVELQLRDVCGGSDAKSKTFRAPLDSSTMSGLPFRLAGSDCIAGGETTVTLGIESSASLQLAPLTFTLAYNRQALELLSATAMPGTPLDGKSLSFSDVAEGAFIQIQDPWESTAGGPLLRFRFRAQMPPGTGDSLRVGMTSPDAIFLKGCQIPRFDSTSFTIFREGALLACVLSIPELRSDSAAQSYDPIPVPVRCDVTNIGTTTSASTDVTIVMPPGLALTAGELPTKPLQPSVLLPGESGSVIWNVLHPLTQTARSYAIGARVPRFPGDAGVPCEDTLRVPPLEGLWLEPVCTVPDSLHYDPNLRLYLPNPFEARLGAVNRGRMSLRNVSGTISLPPGLVLDPSAQPVTRSFTPTVMAPWNSGDPVPEVIWTVRWTATSAATETPVLRFVLDGEDMNGHVIDTISTACSTIIPGSPVEWNCRLTMPDSLGLRQDQTDVEPNPFTVSFELRNNSTMAARVRRVVLNYPPGELELHTSSQHPADLRLDSLIQPRAAWRAAWVLYAPPHKLRRLSKISAVAYDSAGQEIACSDYLPIAGLDTVLATTRIEASIDRFTLYPNPAEHELSVEVALSQPAPTLLLLHDLLGRERRRVSHSDAQLSFTERLDLRGLETGVYMLRLKAGGESHSRMLLVR